MTSDDSISDKERLDRRRGRVLIVNSSSEERLRIRRALAVSDCDIVEAVDGTQAYMMVLASEIDVAITDLDMHPGTGLDFISALSILPIHTLRPEVIFWSPEISMQSGQAQLRDIRVAAKIDPAVGLNRLLAAVDAVLDDPLDFVAER